MFRKKAQGMSLNVIIIAVIVLIILVVLVVIFTGKTKLFGKQTSDTAAQYTGKTCEVPGTNNDKSLDQSSCAAKGGVYDSTTQYDHGYGCCIM